MKVKCIANSGEAFKGGKIPFGYFENSQFNLKVGKEYLVMGISLSEGLLCYLIDEGIPIFYPFQLFEVTDNKLPNNWYFKVYGVDSPFYPYREATWGYKEICSDDEYLSALAENESEAIQLYYKRKSEYEKEA